MSSDTAVKTKKLPALPDRLSEAPALSNRYRPQIGHQKGGQVWCIVGKKSRDELEDYDFPNDQEGPAKKRLEEFQKIWNKQNGWAP